MQIRHEFIRCNCRATIEMRLLAVIIGLGVVAATQAATDLATICAKASDAPKSEDGKDVYTHLCQLQAIHFFLSSKIYILVDTSLFL